MKIAKLYIHLNSPLVGSYPKISHAPKKWPWWKRVHFSHNPISVRPPNFGHRFWMYTRTKAHDMDFVIVRRSA